MKKNTYIISILAIVLILCAAVKPALAYFTDRDWADGAIPLTLHGKTEIQDSYKDYIKTISIQNTEGRAVWIRLRIVAGVTYRDKLVLTPGNGWSDGGDGYWYYGSPVPAGGNTTDFLVDISNIPRDDLDISEQSFNIAAIYESTPVQYNTDGSTIGTGKTADWSIKLDTGTSSPSGEGSGTEGGGGNG